jgi:phage/conjugal plasmid C-4 type zinc finger TraR family protein
MDIVDLASDIEAAERERGLQAVRRQMQGQARADCVDCGDDISGERRQAMPGVQRCTVCQTAAERLRRAYA